MMKINETSIGRSWVIVLLFCLVNVEPAFSKAFPGAEGYGAEVTGGRGGQVIHVINLSASGPGSLQAALDTPGPRIIVFDVSGVISADEIVINHGDFTLAGETAPGGGITLNARLNSDYLNFSVTNFIIRHIRIRPTNLSGNQGDAIRIANNSNFILDHISTSWGSDETVDMYMSHDFTVQWSTLEESATHAGHPDGDYHNFAFINGPDGRNVSLHHNLFAHNRQRTPAIANGMSDIVNNVSYNFWRGFNHHNPSDTAGFNFIGNYYLSGPDENDPIVILIDDEDGTSGSYYYLEDLCYNGTAYQNPWDLVAHYPSNMSPTPSQASSRFNTPAITTHSCTETYDLVLDQAGSWPRDSVTLRTVNEVRSGTGSWGRSVPTDLMEGLTPVQPPTDSDGDGMPNDWEIARGLNPNQADHNGDDDKDGYTNIEEYLHYRSDLLISGEPPVCNNNSTCDLGETYLNCPADCPDVGDTIPPTVPGEIEVLVEGEKNIRLTWSASSDNVAVSGYNIYRNGTLIASSTSLSFMDKNLSKGHTYTYQLSGFDTSGNESEKSAIVVVTLPETNILNLLPRFKQNKE